MDMPMDSMGEMPMGDGMPIDDGSPIAGIPAELVNRLNIDPSPVLQM
jgi:hypothetical protein